MNAAALTAAPVAPATAGAADRASDSVAADLFGAMMQAVGGGTQATPPVKDKATRSDAGAATPEPESDAAPSEPAIDGVLVALLAQPAPTQPAAEAPTGLSADPAPSPEPPTAPAVTAADGEQEPGVPAAPTDAGKVSPAPSLSTLATSVIAPLAEQVAPAQMMSALQPMPSAAAGAATPPPVSPQPRAPAPEAASDPAKVAAQPQAAAQPAPAATTQAAAPVVAELAALLKTARAERVQAKAQAPHVDTAYPEATASEAPTEAGADPAAVGDSLALEQAAPSPKPPTERPLETALSRAPGDRVVNDKTAPSPVSPDVAGIDSAGAPKPAQSSATVEIAASDAAPAQISDTPLPLPVTAEAAAAVDVPADPTPQIVATTKDAAAASPSTQPVNPASLARSTIETTIQLSAKIRRMLEGRSSRFGMVLTPDELGRVDVSVQIDDDGQLTARLAFDNPAAAADMRARADELRSQLRDAGFRLEDGALDFSHRDANANSNGDQSRTPLHQKLGRLFPRLESAEPVLPPSQWTRLNQTPDRVDVRV